MANRRKPYKKSVGGYIDETIKAAIKGYGVDETGFVEWAVVHGLLERGRISKKDVAKLAREGRLNSVTILMLREDGQLPEE